MKVPDVWRNMVPDTWTADREGALPKPGSCPHDNSCVGCRGTEMATSRFFIMCGVVFVVRSECLRVSGIVHSSLICQNLRFVRLRRS